MSDNIYELVNITNHPCETVISRHKSYGAALRADRKLQSAVSRANGAGSYLMTEIRKNGELCPPEED